MKRLTAPRVAGPVGLSFVMAGYSVGLLVARTFVSLIAHCTQSCPSIRLQGFHLHHFYYGLALVMLSIAALVFVEDVRTRWDAALVLGIGGGLVLDEFGLVILGMPYWDIMSVLPIFVFGALLASLSAYAMKRRGLLDFKLLDRTDLLTVTAVLLGVSGFLYFARPVRMFVQVPALLAWAAAVMLLVVYGRRHILKIHRGPLRATE